MSAAANPLDDDNSPVIVLNGEQGMRLTQQLENAARFVLLRTPALTLEDGSSVTLRPATEFLAIRNWPAGPMFEVRLSRTTGATNIMLNGAFLAPFILPNYRFVSTLTETGLVVGIESSTEKITPTQHLQCFLLDFLPALQMHVCTLAMGQEAYLEKFSTQNTNLFRMHALGARLRDDGQPLVNATLTKPIRTPQDLFVSPAPSEVAATGATSTEKKNVAPPSLLSPAAAATDAKKRKMGEIAEATVAL